MFNVEHLIESGGLLLIAAIVFAESGLLVGFFLPGDTLLFSAGLFAAQGKLSLPLVIAVIIGAAFAGDNVGYTIGEKAGHKIFSKEDGILFRKEYLERAQKFYEKHGGKMVLFARFVPIVRTFAPVVTGASDMPRRRFIAYDIVGATIWGGGITLLGYYFGSRIPNIDTYIFPILALVILASVGSSVVHILHDKKTRQQLLAKLKLANKDDQHPS